MICSITDMEVEGFASLYLPNGSSQHSKTLMQCLCPLLLSAICVIHHAFLAQIYCATWDLGIPHQWFDRLHDKLLIAHAVASTQSPALLPSSAPHVVSTWHLNLHSRISTSLYLSSTNASWWHDPQWVGTSSKLAADYKHVCAWLQTTCHSAICGQCAANVNMGTNCKDIKSQLKD